MTPPLVLVASDSASAVQVLYSGAFPISLTRYALSSLWRPGLLALVGKVDAVYVGPNELPDMLGDWQAAVDEARRRKVPVFTTAADLAAWVKARARAASDAARRSDADEALSARGPVVSSEDAAFAARSEDNRVSAMGVGPQDYAGAPR